MVVSPVMFPWSSPQTALLPKHIAGTVCNRIQHLYSSEARNNALAVEIESYQISGVPDHHEQPAISSASVIMAGPTV